jgi:two-component system, OmpR family, response regulator
MRVLLVEDDAKIASFVSKGLQEEGFAVDHFPDAESALSLALTTPYDLGIFDIMLPKLNGFDLISKLRKRKIVFPILILSAKRSVDDRVKGLYGGADDYLVKPFSFAELLARVRVLLRRSTQAGESTSLVIGDLTLNLLSRDVLRAGKQIHLQPREFSLLEYFMRNPDQVISKTMILEHVWNYQFDPQTNVVDVLVCRLRQKVDTGYEKPLLNTIRGVGYVLRKN